MQQPGWCVMGFDDGREAAVAYERERCALICEVLTHFDALTAPYLMGQAVRLIREGYDMRPEIGPNKQIKGFRDHLCTKCRKPIGSGEVVLVGTAVGHEGPRGVFHPECQSYL